MKEDEIRDAIHKNCKPFLNEFWSDIKRGYGVYRGWKTSPEWKYRQVTPRKNRVPTDMNQEVSKRIDEWSKKKFGWKWRSEGVFTSTSVHIASGYGDEVYSFIPVGQYKYLYHPDYSDSLDMAPSNPGVLDPKHATYTKRVAESFEDDLKGVKDKGLSRYIDAGVEVAWKCKRYYLVNHYDLGEFLES